MTAEGESAETPWYADGLRFGCTQCGNCCTGPPGAVWFDDDEGAAMAAELGLDEATFRRRFARRIGGKWSLREHRTEHGFDCVFLDRESAPGRATCRLYGSRPTQCRTWPFWPDMLESREAWERAKRETPCPGMDAPNGTLYPVEAIRIQRDESQAADDASALPDW